jgi:hypothetical protein
MSDRRIGRKYGFSRRSPPVVRGLAGSVVSLRPAVEMLGEGLAGDSQLAAFGADPHPRAEFGRGARAREAALLTRDPA